MTFINLNDFSFAKSMSKGFELLEVKWSEGDD